MIMNYTAMTYRHGHVGKSHTDAVAVAGTCTSSVSAGELTATPKSGRSKQVGRQCTNSNTTPRLRHHRVAKEKLTSLTLGRLKVNPIVATALAPFNRMTTLAAVSALWANGMISVGISNGAGWG